MDVFSVLWSRRSLYIEKLTLIVSQPARMMAESNTSTVTLRVVENGGEHGQRTIGGI
jgi:hypothetical protein